jgi:hypothetical protein
MSWFIFIVLPPGRYGDEHYFHLGLTISVDVSKNLSSSILRVENVGTPGFSETPKTSGM